MWTQRLVYIKILPSTVQMFFLGLLIVFDSEKLEHNKM